MKKRTKFFAMDPDIITSASQAALMHHEVRDVAKQLAKLSRACWEIHALILDQNGICDEAADWWQLSSHIEGLETGMKLGAYSESFGLTPNERRLMRAGHSYKVDVVRAIRQRRGCSVDQAKSLLEAHPECRATWKSA